MKKCMTLLMALLMLTLAACGGREEKPAETKEVDLTAFYDELAGQYGWEALTDIEGEMLESSYPGLSEIAAKQFIAKAPMMSAVVNELVLMQCETEEDAAKAAAILEERIAYQVGDENNPGGAWYPESIEGWKKAQVLQQGSYVALIASAENQDAIVEQFNQLFQA